MSDTSAISISGLWEALTAAHSEDIQRSHRILKARENTEGSLYVEGLVCAWLYSMGYQVDAAEMWGDRILSSRRRDRNKTCDFRVLKSGKIIDVEVKHGWMLDGGSATDFEGIDSFLKSALAKGARWLCVGILERPVSQLTSLSAVEVAPEDWTRWVPPKRALAMRRNGLTRLTILQIS